MGSIIGGTAKDGKRLKKKFLDNTPALKTLREGVLLAAERGWVKGIDGRKVRVRSAHAALNTLLQSCGAVIMKVALRILVQDLNKTDIDYRLVGNVHDEFGIEVLNKDVTRLKELCLSCFLKAGEELKIRIPIEGECKSGSNWSETH